MICLILDSNSHLYFVPATSVLISSAKILFSFIENGTFPAIISCANPSTMAVFPTPGSHTSTGLFLVFLLRIERSLSISLSLPITLSSFFSRASLVRSVEKKSSAGVFDSLFLLGCLLLSNGVASSLLFSIIPQKRFSAIAPIILSRGSSKFCPLLIFGFTPSIAQDLFKSVRFFSISLGLIHT